MNRVGKIYYKTIHIIRCIENVVCFRLLCLWPNSENSIKR